jgi:hypothetical protein
VSVDGEIGFGEWGALAHPTYVRTPMLPRVAHLHISLLYSSSIDEATRCASLIPWSQGLTMGSATSSFETNNKADMAREHLCAHSSHSWSSSTSSEQGSMPAGSAAVAADACKAGRVVF